MNEATGVARTMRMSGENSASMSSKRAVSTARSVPSRVPAAKPPKILSSESRAAFQNSGLPHSSSSVPRTEIGEGRISSCET